MWGPLRFTPSNRGLLGVNARTTNKSDAVPRKNDRAAGRQKEREDVNIIAVVRKLALGTLAISSFLASGSAPAHAQAATTQKPNIVVIMGDDIGWM
jgi:hypothetical protein